MKQACGILCAVGLAVLTTALLWWVLNRGEVIQEIPLLVHKRDGAGVPAPLKIEVDKVDAMLGPFDLSPADNPILLVLATDTRYRGSAPTLYAIASLADKDANGVWLDKQPVSFSLKSKHGHFIMFHTAFKPIEVQTPGRYTMRCRFESEPPDWFRHQRWSLDFKLSLRRKAVASPMFWALAGALLAIGAGVPFVTFCRMGDARPSDVGVPP